MYFSDGKFRRYSNRFVYWKTNEKKIFALNVVCSADIDKLFNVSNQNNLNNLLTKNLNEKSNFLANKMTQKLDENELYINVHYALILSMRHGIIIENLVLTFKKCFLHFQPPDTLQIFDENEICMLTTSAVSFFLYKKKEYYFFYY